jgi:hypothetical protein
MAMQSDRLTEAQAAHGLSTAGELKETDLEDLQESFQGWARPSEFRQRVLRERQDSESKKENYLDFYKKYLDKHLDGKKAEEPEINLGGVIAEWCLVFQLRELSAEEVEAASAPNSNPPGEKEKKHKKHKKDSKHEDEQAQPADDEELRRVQDLEVQEDGTLRVITSECMEICQRLWAADLDVGFEMSTRGEEVYISVGAPYEVLVMEANETKPMMRLKACKGGVEFNSDMISYYTPDMFEEPSKATCFTSGLRQRLVMSRITRVAGVNLAERERHIPREMALRHMQTHLEKGHRIRAPLVRELLATHGGFRPKAGKLMGPEIEVLAEKCLVDPFFKVDPPHTLTKKELADLHASEEHMRAHGQTVVTYEEVQKATECIDRWVAKEPGKSEVCSGSLRIFFPLHHKQERDYLTQSWGSFNLIFQLFAYGKTREGANTVSYYNESMDTRHIAFFWTPIDTIRDYYGDQVGLYSAWLMLYTRALLWPAAIGLILWVQSLVADGIDVNNNNMVVPYSIFLCMWSASYTSMWKRRENELKFLWASEDTEETAPIRAQFDGKITINDDTHEEDVEHPSVILRLLKVFGSAGTSLTIVCIVIFSAFTASTIGFYNAPKNCADHSQCTVDEIFCEALTEALPGSNATVNHTYTYVGDSTNLNPVMCEDEFGTHGSMEAFNAANGFAASQVTTMVWHDGYPAGTTAYQKNKYKWGAALANTVMIVIFGMVYERIAVKLTDWENHKTQIEYDDSLIIKNFGFQFVNNYFILFYIAYMRQVDTTALGGPEVEVTQCAGGSCLGQLQTQLIVVFTTKTAAAQFVEIFKPTLKRHVLRLKELLHVRQLTNMLTTMEAHFEQKLLSDEQEIERGVDEETLQRDAALEEKKAALERRLMDHQKGDFTSDCEKESFWDDYDSTFDDFNEMLIQFGYLALFSPVFPLASVLALINNILEIRVDAGKLCRSMRRPVWLAQEDIGSWYTVMLVLGFVAVLTNATMVTFVGKTMVDEGSEEDLGGLSARVKSWSLWATAMAIEHSILVLRVAVLLAVPELPGWVVKAEQVLKWHTSKMMPASELERLKLSKRKFRDKLLGHDDDDGDGDELSPRDQEHVNILGAMAKGTTYFQRKAYNASLERPAGAVEGDAGAESEEQGGGGGEGGVAAPGVKVVNPMMNEDSRLATE